MEELQYPHFRLMDKLLDHECSACLEVTKVEETFLSILQARIQQLSPKPAPKVWWEEEWTE